MKKKFISISFIILLLPLLFQSTMLVHANTQSNIQTQMNYIKNMNNTLAQTSFTKKEINTANEYNKQIVYSSIIERSNKAKFVRKLSKLLHHPKGELSYFLDKHKINLLNFIGFAISMWNKYTGESTKILYHTFRHFGASKYEANQFARILVSAIG